MWNLTKLFFKKNVCFKNQDVVRQALSDTAGWRLKQNFFNLPNFAVIAFEHPPTLSSSCYRSCHFYIVWNAPLGLTQISMKVEKMCQRFLFSWRQPTIYHSNPVCSAMQFTVHKEETNLLQMVRLMFLDKKRSKHPTSEIDITVLSVLGNQQKHVMVIAHVNCYGPLNTFWDSFLRTFEFFVNLQL